MYYVCIENNAIVSVAPYRPGVPESVEVVEITNEQHASIEASTHYFNIATKAVELIPVDGLNKLATLKQNEECAKFLSSTDWKIMRHIRQKALGIETTLSEEEYIALETQRQEAAAKIIII